MQIVKHSPNTKLQLLVQRETTFLVRAKTPYIAAIKRIDKIFEKFDKNPKFKRGEYKKVNYITVKGMGRAIDTTVSLGLHYKGKHYKVETLTGTVEVLDEIVTELNLDTKDSDTESLYRKRKASYVEIRIWLKRDLLG